MNNNYLALSVDDYGTVSFYSGVIFYIDTFENIKRFIQGIQKSDSVKEFREDLYNTLKVYEKGNKEVCHSVAYADIQFLRKVQVFHSSETKYEDLSWFAMNVFDCPYKMSAKEAKIQRIWVSYKLNNNYIYARYCKPLFKGFLFEDEKYNDSINWGIPNLIKSDDDTAFSSLYIPERFFDCKKSLEEDMQNMQFNPNLDLREFLYGIVADG